MSQQLATRNNNQIAAAPSESEFGVMKEQAKMLIASKFLPSSITTPEQAIAVILTGRELGIGTMAALNNITVIQQKPTVSPQLMLALIERSGLLENIIIKPNHSPDGRTSQVAVTMKRKGRTEHTEIFGTSEAMALRLLDKDNYKKQAATMFKWRAVAACARVVFPDVILGLYTPDEVGADVEVTDTEEIIAAPAEEIRSPIVVKMPEKPVEAETVEPIAAEPVFDEPQTRTDELKQHREKSVTPATKGKLLVERGCVKQTNIGFDVKDEDHAEYYTVTKPGGVIHCTCADYTEGRAKDGSYRCAHIEAVKLFIWNKQQQQKQAA
jgi:hypothetical protein